MCGLSGYTYDKSGFVLWKSGCDMKLVKQVFWLRYIRKRKNTTITAHICSLITENKRNRIKKKQYISTFVKIHNI
jgi:hypothetical protein